MWVGYIRKQQTVNSDSGKYYWLQAFRISCVGVDVVLIEELALTESDDFSSD